MRKYDRGIGEQYHDAYRIVTDKLDELEHITSFSDSAVEFSEKQSTFVTDCVGLKDNATHLALYSDRIITILEDSFVEGTKRVCTEFNLKNMTDDDLYYIHLTISKMQEYIAESYNITDQVKGKRADKGRAIVLEMCCDTFYKFFNS